MWFTQNYEVIFSEVRLWIPESKVYTYPDLMVVAGDLAFHENRNDTITNPVLIVEVLSKSTSSYDRGEKFSFYRTIPTLQEYILVEQDRVEVNLFGKVAENKWELDILQDLEAQISLSSIPATLSVSNIYEKVQFIVT